MQTRFDALKLKDPGTAAAAGAIRNCVHCGFCTATCPTYVLLGNELDSPRGRIYLIKDMLEQSARPSAEVVKHLDRCLSCLSCETHCPSGVSYRRVIDQGRAYVEANYRRPWPDQAVRTLLARVLPYRSRLRLALALAGLVQPLEGWLARYDILAPLAALLRLRRVARSTAARADRSVPSASRAHQSSAAASTAFTPSAPAVTPDAAGVAAPRAGAGLRVGVAGGCVGSVLEPAIEAATVRLLTRAGCTVVRVRREGCCGALAHHMGREAESKRLARAQVDAWCREIEQGPLDAIVVTTSGCGPVIRDYGHQLADDPRYTGPAARVAALACDVSELMARIGLPPVTVRFPEPVRVGYHPACSLQHGRGITSEPTQLLAAAGFEVKLPAQAHLCCGSAGVYNILQPRIAGELGERKAAALAALEPTVIATGNIGCMMQIRASSRLPVAHVAELLDWATGGLRPAGLG